MLFSSRKSAIHTCTHIREDNRPTNDYRQDETNMEHNRPQPEISCHYILIPWSRFFLYRANRPYRHNQTPTQTSSHTYTPSYISSHTHISTLSSYSQYYRHHIVFCRFPCQCHRWRGVAYQIHEEDGQRVQRKLQSGKHAYRQVRDLAKISANQIADKPLYIGKNSPS